ncbi:hypothetical protein [Streptomyces sp. NPDC090798]|uniref:hypothetical protein n=1 Tax=Streptomyces sp. NPDC090798 TaxID=3365968 RepID=UPI00382F4D9F
MSLTQVVRDPASCQVPAARPGNATAVQEFDHPRASPHRAGVTNRCGTAEDLESADRPEPEMTPGAALVRVIATGVDPVDQKLTQGDLDSLMGVGFPLIRGWGLARLVERSSSGRAAQRDACVW